MNRATGRFSALFPLALAAALSGAAGGEVETREVPIDRWLISEPFEASGDTEPLATSFLDAPGEPGVLPDRGLEAAGTTWRLVRRDGEESVPLDSILAETDSGTVVYAHAYVRLDADRTLRLHWSGTACTGVRAWLNGRGLTESPQDVRLGAGWNTLLLKAVAGDCPFGFRASFAGTGQTREPLPKVRIQASRPPGDVRTGPAPWVLADDTARIAARQVWKDDRLSASLEVGLTGWAPLPIGDVRVELRDGPDGEITVASLEPGDTEVVLVPIAVDEAEKVLDEGRVRARVEWGDEEVDVALAVAGVDPSRRREVLLEGWEFWRAGTDAGERGLPAGRGWRAFGAWKVPRSLGGRTLVLDRSGSPGRYELDGAALAGKDDAVVLCDPCRRGLELRLSVVTSDAWLTLPVVRVRAPGGE